MYASSYSRAILVKGESWAAEVNSYLRKHNMEKYLDKIANRVDDWWIRAEILVKDFSGSIDISFLHQLVSSSLYFLSILPKSFIQVLPTIFRCKYFLIFMNGEARPDEFNYRTLLSHCPLRFTKIVTTLIHIQRLINRINRLWIKTYLKLGKQLCRNCWNIHSRGYRQQNSFCAAIEGEL